MSIAIIKKEEHIVNLSFFLLPLFHAIISCFLVSLRPGQQIIEDITS